MKQVENWSEDARQIAGLLIVFIAFGAICGILSGEGLHIGALAGALLFAVVLGTGWLCNLGNPRRR